MDASRKRGWGDSKGSTASANTVSISSNSLKDLVPDIKPLLDTEATIEEEIEEGSVDSDTDIAGTKIPDNVKKDAEPPDKTEGSESFDDLVEMVAKVEENFEDTVPGESGGVDISDEKPENLVEGSCINNGQWVSQMNHEAVPRGQEKDKLRF